VHDRGGPGPLGAQVQDTFTRTIERVGDELLDGDRLSDLFDISVHEVAWRKGHRYLTLVGDHRTGPAGAWLTEGGGV